MKSDTYQSNKWEEELEEIIRKFMKEKFGEGITNVIIV